VRYVRPLTENQRHTLAEIMKHDAAPRARVRAHSLLLSEQRMQIKEIAKIYQVDRDTVAAWIKKWEQMGVESLYDKPRSGRPPKLTLAEKDLARQYIKEERDCSEHTGLPPTDVYRIVRVLTFERGGQPDVRSR